MVANRIQLKINNMSELHGSKPIPIPVDFLCKEGEKFYIPSYQRGYKWGKNEIEALLDDLCQYKPGKNDEFYCLQPIVVRWDGEHKHWRVIDGQQRLTTIFIILQFDTSSASKSFSLDYERGTKLNCLNKDNIEIITSDSESFHISTAYKIIEKWNSQTNNGLESVIELLKSEKTRFIWYKLNTPDDKIKALEIEHSYFMKLNSGKISLTEAELIKALLLHNNCASENCHSAISQTFMAEEWNRMERYLRQPEVWSFIAGSEPVPANAMDKLLELIWKSLDSKIKEPYRNIDFPIFAWAEKQDADKLWQHIVLVFRMIMGWFEDNETHNLVGYFASGKSTDDVIAKSLSELAPFEKSNLPIPTKNTFLKKLWISTLTHKGLICSTDENGQLPPVIDLNVYHKYRFDNISDKKKIFNILLLVNIVHLTLLGKEPRKFDFVKFNDPKNPWNVEHVSPANPKSNLELKNLLEKVRDERAEEKTSYKLPSTILEMIKLLSKVDSCDNDNLNELIGLDPSEVEKFMELKSHLIPENSDDTMTIDNLSLLTERCNKGIGNRFFFDKRQRLMKYQSEGQYIPLLTLHVFTKWYSPKNDYPWFWSEEDRTAYLKELDSYIQKIKNHIEQL